MTNRTRYRTEAQLKALFEQAVRAIGFYEAQRKEVLVALESLRRALNARRPKPPTPLALPENDCWRFVASSITLATTAITIAAPSVTMTASWNRRNYQDQDPLRVFPHKT